MIWVISASFEVAAVAIEAQVNAATPRLGTTRILKINFINLPDRGELARE
jgi:hypothetical protein